MIKNSTFEQLRELGMQIPVILSNLENVNEEFSITVHDWDLSKERKNEYTIKLSVKELDS